MPPVPPRWARTPARANNLVGPPFGRSVIIRATSVHVVQRSRTDGSGPSLLHLPKQSDPAHGGVTYRQTGEAPPLSPPAWVTFGAIQAVFSASLICPLFRCRNAGGRCERARDEGRRWWSGCAGGLRLLQVRRPASQDLREFARSPNSFRLMFHITSFFTCASGFYGHWYTASGSPLSSELSRGSGALVSLLLSDLGCILSEFSVKSSICSATPPERDG